MINNIKREIVESGKWPDNQHQQYGHFYSRMLDKNQYRGDYARKQKEQPFQVDDFHICHISHKFRPVKYFSCKVR